MSLMSDSPSGEQDVSINLAVLRGWAAQCGSDTSIMLLESAMMTGMRQGLSQMLCGWRRYVGFPFGSVNLVESGYCMSAECFARSQRGYNHQR